MVEKQKMNASRVGEELLALIQNGILATLLVFTVLFALSIFQVSLQSWTPVAIVSAGLALWFHFVVGMHRPWTD